VALGARSSVRCIGCGALMPEVDGPGPTHAYMPASQGCWQLYGEMAAREYGDPAYRTSGRQIVDAYAVQHTGINERRTAQSVWVHLISLCLVLEHGLAVEDSIRAMRRVVAGRPTFAWLPPPPSLGEVTVIDLHAATTAAQHTAIARR